MLKSGRDLLSCLAFARSSAKSKSSSCVKIFHWIPLLFPLVSVFTGLEIRGILVANATKFSHLLPGFSCGSKQCYCHKFMVLLI